MFPPAFISEREADFWPMVLQSMTRGHHFEYVKCPYKCTRSFGWIIQNCRWWMKIVTRFWTTWTRSFRFTYLRVKNKLITSKPTLSLWRISNVAYLPCFCNCVIKNWLPLEVCRCSVGRANSGCLEPSRQKNIGVLRTVTSGDVTVKNKICVLVISQGANSTTFYSEFREFHFHFRFANPCLFIRSSNSGIFSEEFPWGNSCFHVYKSLEFSVRSIT